jgi:hypothetical protein
MSQLVKTKRQANFKGFKRFGAFKRLVEQKNVVFNSFVCKLGLFLALVGRGPLKRSFHSCFKMTHACQKRPNLHTNSSNKLLFFLLVTYFAYLKHASACIIPTFKNARFLKFLWQHQQPERT